MTLLDGIEYMITMFGFDIVYTSYNVINWLHDIKQWGESHNLAVRARAGPGRVLL